MLSLVLFIFISIVYFYLQRNNINFSFLKLKKIIPVIIILFIMICLIIFSDSTYIVAKESFMLWVNNIVPSLLPFFICTQLLKSTPFINIINKLLTPLVKPIFNVPGCGLFAISMGMMSGYPTGAKISAELYSEKKCSKIEAERLLAFTNTSGPLFIVSAVGVGMFGNPKIGLLLLITHLLGSISVGLIFRKYKSKYTESSTHSSRIISQNSPKIKKISNNDMHNDNPLNKQPTYLNLNNLGAMMGNAIQSSIATLLLILGFIVSFSILNHILMKLNIIPLIANLLNPIWNLFNIPDNARIGFVKGILEVTTGLNTVSSAMMFDNINLSLVLSALLLGFGGISVMMQTASIISSSGLSMKPYFIGKLLHGIISSFYTFLILKYVPFFNLRVVETFSLNNKYPVLVEETTNMINTFLGLILVCIIYLLYASHRKKIE